MTCSSIPGGLQVPCADQANGMSRIDKNTHRHPSHQWLANSEDSTRTSSTTIHDSKTDSVGEIDLVLKLREIYAQNKAHF